MCSSAMLVQQSEGLQSVQDERQWYAVVTRPRHEKKISEELRRRCITEFLPLMSAIHRWSDRRKFVTLPLFPGYVFVRIVPTAENKVSVLRVGGVLHLVGASGQGTPINDIEIENIRAILSSNLHVSETGFLRVGQRVRIRGGALDGVEGILAQCGRRLIVSVDAIQRSLSVELEGFGIEPL